MITRMSAMLVAALLMVLLAAMALAGQSDQAPKKLRIVATTGMIADMVREIGGDRVEVTALMGSGVDPHLYKPTRSDIAAVMSADIVFYNGLLLEGKMVDAFVRAATSGKKVFAVTELIDESQLVTPDGGHGLHDPHVWMDPSVWGLGVNVVRDRLIEADPAGKPQYDGSAAAYAQMVRSLDEYAKQALGSVPAASRVLVTAHDAFNYFGKRYGFEVMGIQGISTESEAGVRDIERIVLTLVERKIGAVFVESTVADRNVRALVAGAQARGHAVRIGGELFSDAMGRPGTYEGTYQGMIDHNVTTIARALGGDAPERGMVGKLGTSDGPR
jgi:manganese/zinc/iron transport system substrate-binding protein